MGSSPVVSVVIPAYNHAEYILACLDSVFKQTYRDFEVLLIDDGSPDQTANLVRPFVGNGTIRYFRQENSGQAQARNRGLQEARGKYIAFLDDDDLWPSDKLEWQVAALEDNPWCAVGGTVEVLGDPSQNSDIPAPPPLFITPASVYCGNPFRSPGQVLARTGALRSAGGFDASVWGCDDMDLWIRLAAVGTLVRVSRHALLYRRHPQGASSNTRRMLENALKVLIKNASILAEEDRASTLQKGYRWLYRDYGFHLLYKAVKSKPPTSSDVLLFARAFMGPLIRDRHLAWMVMQDTIIRPAKKLLFHNRLWS